MTQFRIYFKNGQREVTHLTPDEIHRRHPGEVKKIQRLGGNDGPVRKNLPGRPEGSVEHQAAGVEGGQPRRDQCQEVEEGR